MSYYPMSLNNSSINNNSHKSNQAEYLSKQINELHTVDIKLETLKLKYESLSKELQHSINLSKTKDKENQLRTNFYQTQLEDLKLDLDSLNFLLLEKINQNKLLFNEYNSLQLSFENKISEVNKLNQKIQSYDDSNRLLMKEKEELENAINDLREIKKQNKLYIEQIVKENNNLSDVCNQQEERIKSLETEKKKLLMLNGELNKENLDIYNKLKVKDDILNNSSIQMEEINKEYYYLLEKVKELEGKKSLLIKEIESKSKDSKSFIEKGLEKEKQKEEAIHKVRDSEYEIRKLEEENEISKNIRNKLYQDNIKLYNLIEKLRCKLMEISEQNENLNKVIDSLTIENENLKNHFLNREKVNNFSTSRIIKDSIDKMEEISIRK